MSIIRNRCLDDIPVLKLGIVGPNMSGKTSLSYALLGEHVEEMYTPTIGMDYKCGINITRKVHLKMWDFSGDDKFFELTKPFVYENEIVIFCYNCRDRESFFKMRNIYNKYDLDKTIIVATMLDLDVNEKEKFEEYSLLGSHFAKSQGAEYVEVSSYTKEGISDLLDKILNLKKGKGKNRDFAGETKTESHNIDQTCCDWFIELFC